MSQTRGFEEFTMRESEREAFLERIRASVNAEDYRRIQGMSYALPELIALIEQEPMTMRKLRHLLFGPKTEKMANVCSEAAASPPEAAKPKAKGHGRTQAKAYTGARWVQIPHPELKAGNGCPHCFQGKVRSQNSKALILR